MTTSRTNTPDAALDPSLTLLLGPCNSGKMGHLLDWWSRHAGLKPVVVTPTRAVSDAFTDEMARRVGAVFGQSQAMTFDRFARTVLGEPSLRVVTDLDRTLLVSRLLGDLELSALEPVASLPGSVGAVKALLQELGESGHSWQNLARILKRWGEIDASAKDLAADIRRLVVAYSAACAGGRWLDAPSAVQRAEERAAQWERPVAVYGFTSFTLGQRRLLRALSSRVPVILAFNHEEGRTIELTPASEVHSWRHIATQIVQLDRQDRAYSSPSIAHLERHFLAPPIDPVPPESGGPEGVRLLLASGQRNEAELAAEHIAGLLRDGFRPGDIAVIVRNVGSWKRLLGHVFDSCSIPYCLDEIEMLGETGLGAAFLSIFDIVFDDDGRALLTFARSPYSGLTPDDAADLELRCRLDGIVNARTMAELDGLSCRLRWLWGPFKSTDGTAQLDCGKAVHLAQRMLLHGVQRGGDCEADAVAHAALARSLDLIAGDQQRSSQSRTEARVIKQILTRVPVSPKENCSDAVQVLSAHRARARRFAAVFVLGLVEGEFPGAPRSTSLLNRAQRASLESAAGGRLFDQEESHEEGLFLTAVSRAWQVLYLSARDADDGGTEATPSRFWEASAAALGRLPAGSQRRTLREVTFAPSAAPSLRHYLRACALNREEPAVGVGALSSPRGWHRPAPQLNNPQVLADFLAIEVFSPSGLESYIECPYAWFLGRVMHLNDFGAVFDNRIIGRLLHRVLSVTYQELSLRGLLPLRPAGVAQAEELACEAISRLLIDGTTPGSVADKRLAERQMKRLVLNLFALESASAGRLATQSTETWVGGSEGIDVGGLRVRGRVDRIDADAEGGCLFVLDYKVGKTPRPSSVGQKAIQVPLYLMALDRSRPDLEVAGGAYLSLTESGVVGFARKEMAGNLGGHVDRCRKLDEEEFEELLKKTREAACAAASDIRSGMIAPSKEKECPHWCSYGSVCRSKRDGYRL